MSEAISEDGVSILPIPPPLEFPFPRTSAESAAARSATTLQTSPESQSPTANSTPARTSDPLAVKESGALIDTNSQQPQPNKPQKKSVAERVPLRQRGSILWSHARRGTENVGERPRAQQGNSILGTFGRRKPEDLRDIHNTQNWGSDSDDSTSSSLSSSSEDERPHGPLKRKTTWGAHDATQNISGKRQSKKKSYNKFNVGNDGYKSRGRVSKRDGRLQISIKETQNQGYLTKALGATLKKVNYGGRDENEPDEPYSPLREDDAPSLSRTKTESTSASVYDKNPMPALNVVIMVIGSRGDIQPFLRLGKILKEEHGHRVRIATHPAFKKFVEQDSGLEFFSVGGDPAEIMAFMVKNPGLIPKTATVRSGEIGRRRESMYEMFRGFWRACINETDNERNHENLEMMANKHPFVADAIIANPPSFAHVHCAERLGVPLHLMFTFPMSPTQQFPHPLCNIKKSNVAANYTNFMTYPLVEMMMWQGLGDLVNKFREKDLGLEPVSTLWAPGSLFRLKVPYTYLWSPALVPKPSDWGPEIDITGFVFLDLASSFKPPETLTKFLEGGEPPVYIGFGSIVVDDPDKFTALIFEAVKRSGVRALVSKGWGGLGDENNTPDNVYMLENTPHDWLFPKVSALVHHGGAGTTAIGLKCGKPTMIVPFFGDQPFWGAMIAKAGAGAEPVPYKHLSAEKLAEAIRTLLTPEARENAKKIARDIEAEGDGAINAVKSFHRSLPLRGDRSLRCSILQDRVAVWSLRKTYVRLSALAAEILVQRRRIKWDDLRLVRHYEWNDFEGPGEPFSGAGAAFASSMGKAAHGIGRTPFRIAKTIKKHELRDRKRQLMHRKNSTERGSREFNTMQGGNVHNVDPDHNQGKLSNGGEHGIEKHLPEGNGNAAGNGIAQYTSEPRKSINNISGTVNEDLDDDDTPSLLAAALEGSDDNLAEEIAADTAAGFAKTAAALTKAPMDITVAVAQGFHNAPRLYGDSTVRRPTRITGIHSGLKAAGEEFVFGVYDGVTGLVKHPYQGGKEGPVGFVKGIGKGVGGFVLKDLAAIIGPFGYTMKGLHKEIKKGHQPTAFIMHARIIQGQKDFRALDSEARAKETGEVEKGWRIIADVRKDVEEKKKNGLRGRIALRKERNRWQKNGVYESVEVAGRALEAQRAGEDFGEVFEKHRWELRKSKAPRKSTMGHSRRLKNQTGEPNGTAANGHAVNGDTRQQNSTEVAGENTGTEVGDKATGTIPRPAEALVNANISFLEPIPETGGTMNGSASKGAQDSETTHLNDATNRAEYAH
ncbi:hypothetical protein MMC18_004114 [Xylographa bjoerkii]|nr:hypothetical protein [Xylographa bjoerkii]